jgi:hypothetical protein
LYLEALALQSTGTDRNNAESYRDQQWPTADLPSERRHFSFVIQPVGRRMKADERKLPGPVERASASTTPPLSRCLSGAFEIDRACWQDGPELARGLVEEKERSIGLAEVHLPPDLRGRILRENGPVAYGTAPGFAQRASCEKAHDVVVLGEEHL